MPSLALVGAVALFVAAGNWQGRRMHEKEALREQFDTAAASAPVELAALSASADWPALRYRAVVASGAYDAHRQVLIDNRVHDGRAGYQVVTPLRLADGRTVLVDRGWTPVGASRAILPSVPPPPGKLRVVGTITMPPSSFLELARTPTDGIVWQNLDLARFTAVTGVETLPIVIEATIAPVPDDGLVRDWPPPDFGIEKHRIYMVQWYAFAALAIVLWLVHARRRAPRADN